MSVPSNRLLSLGTGASLAILALASFSANAEPSKAPTAEAVEARGQATKANPPVGFAQAQSDLPVDPAVRFGTLPNGMTYVIYKNRTPPGAASVWMRIEAGSVMEGEDQRGLAHFIEHMAFNGSKNVPEGEMIKLLQRDGLQFGADTNAQTTPFQTVYMLNLPRAETKVVENALFLMRETAGNISFDAAAIDRERGVILGEERARSTAAYRAYEESLKFLLPGSKYAERMPIGLVDVIKTAQRPAFIRFYNDFYRPEYTTLIVVGDVDPDSVEADIRRRFADWRPGPVSKSALTDYGKVSPRTTLAARVLAADGLNDIMSVSWVNPPEDGVETRATKLNGRLFEIANGILGERFARLANAPDSALLGAALQKEGVAHTALTYTLVVAPKEGQDRAAFDQATAALRDYIANGPTDVELERAVSAFDRIYREGAAAAQTIPSQALASLVVEALATQAVIQSPQQSLAEWELTKPAVTKAAIGAVLQRVMAGGEPVLWRQSDREAPFDAAAMRAAWQAASTRPVEKSAERAAASWPYTDFGTPSKIVSRRKLAGTGATRVTFANGVVLNVKPTSFEDNSVHVAVQVGTGVIGVRPDQAAALFMAKQVGIAEGGLGKLSGDDVRDALAGTVYGFGMTIGSNATLLSGSTSTGDLAVQLQLLAAAISDPGLRPEALLRAKAALPSFYKDGRTSPDGVFAMDAMGAFYNDDPRFAPPSLRDAQAVSNDAVAALIRDQLGRGPVEVSIVGDIDLDVAIREVASTLGALPPRRSSDLRASQDPVRFPSRNLHRIYTHDGRDDQNLSVIAWPTADYSNARRAAILDVLAAVMTMREFEEVREQQGASYSASATSQSSRYFRGFGFIASRATVRPEVDDTYYRTVSDIAAALRRAPVSKDELDRARGPLIERLHNEKNGNAYWLTLLSGSIRDPRQIGVVDGRERDLLSVTPKDIQAAAKTYLKMERALRVQVKPR